MRKKKLPLIVDRDKIIESIYHIVYIGRIIRSLHSTFLSIADKINQDEKNVIRYSIQSNVMLDTISLVDELNKFLFNYENSIDISVKIKIESFKHIIEPILIEIGKWTTFRQFRNNVLAHNFRIDSKNYKSVFFNNALRNYVIPNSTTDLLTLFQYIDQITKIAEELFRYEYEEGLNIYKNLQKEDIPMQQSAEYETIKINGIINEVNKRINDYNEGTLEIKIPL